MNTKLATSTDKKALSIRQGYLKKQSPSILHRWQNRFFVIHPESKSIVYFKEQEDSTDEAKRKGLIHIKDIKHIESRDDAEFHLVCAERTYNLRASNSAERTCWIQSIRSLREGSSRLHHHIHHELTPTTIHKEPIMNISEKHSVDVRDAKLSEGALITETVTEAVPVFETANSMLSDDVHYYNATSQFIESDSNKMREFIVVEKIINGNGKEKTFRFTAPKNAEVNIKFSKSVFPSETLTSMTETTTTTTAPFSVDTSMPLVAEQMTTSEYVPSSTIGFSGTAPMGYPENTTMGYPENTTMGYPQDQAATFKTSTIQETPIIRDSEIQAGATRF